VDITVYLPDEVGQWAKDAKLNLSALLREAVIRERDSRMLFERMSDKAKVMLLQVEDREGRSYTARLTGTPIAEDVYVADDERVFYYDARRLDLVEIQDPEEELRNYLDEGDYIEAMNALGIDPVVDV
jgi:post-segregation antitoxin (ccd killing protein)